MSMQVHPALEFLRVQSRSGGSPMHLTRFDSACLMVVLVGGFLGSVSMSRVMEKHRLHPNSGPTEIKDHPSTSS